MFTLPGVDAAIPPIYAHHIDPPKKTVIAGYIGGDAEHVWSVSEWNHFNGYRKLPIFVRSNPAVVKAENDAFEALRALYRLNVPKGNAVSWDMEEAINPDYLHVIGRVMHWAGFLVWPYGSKNFIFNNPPLDGYWVAEYLKNQPPHMVNRPFVRGTQYAADVSGWDRSLWHRTPVKRRLIWK